MTGFWGQAAVHLALCAAAFGAVEGFVGGRRRSQSLGNQARWAAYALFGFMSVALLVMEYALLTHDFSVSYVARVGSRETPPFYTAISLWSSLEGSILLWGWILALYTALLAFLYRQRHADYMPYTLGTLLSIGVFFVFLIAGPANPFETVFPVPDNGPGPNPLLQNHPLMGFHPPALYFGYVGMAVPFAIASSALLRGRIGTAWLRPLRIWAMIPWTFLTVGIVAGGWWSYEVLGWGGYWAWDPVENASFLPWLAATAFLHSLMVHERRGLLKPWTLSLLMGTFCLTVLGTFMTRSGVFNSVHAFSQSEIGPLFLGFLAVSVFWSAGLLAVRSELLGAEGNLDAAVSRETTFLLNNVLFLGFTLTVLLGTVFPLLAEALRGVRVSVGTPYFNRMCVPLGVAILFLMGVGPVLPWGRADSSRLWKELGIPGLLGVLVVILCVVAGLREPWPLLTFGLAGFVTVVTLREFLTPTRHRMASSDVGFIEALVHVVSRNRRRFGGYIVHLGVVAIIVAIAASWNYKQRQEFTLKPGEGFDLAGYRVTFRDIEAVKEPQRFAVVTALDVSRNNNPVTTLRPRNNYYRTQREPVGTPAVHSTASGDLYVTLLSFEKDGSQVSVQAMWHPLVAWIWWTTPVLVLGSLLSMWPARRSRSPAREVSKGKAEAVPPGAVPEGASAAVEASP